MSSNKMPHVSVVLPVYNGEPFLKEAIDSVLSQTSRDFELLIGDDRSSDRSAEIIARYCDTRIRAFRWERNGGLFVNVNRLLRETRADLIHFLCQDDILEPQCLEREAAFHARHSDLGMSYCQSYYIDDRSVISPVGDPDQGTPERLEPWLSRQLFFYNGCLPGNLSVVMLPRRTLDRFGFFRGDFCAFGDFEMWWRIGQELVIGVQKERLVRIRQHAGELSLAPRSSIECFRESASLRQEIITRQPSSSRAHLFWYERSYHQVLEAHYLVKLILHRDFKSSLSLMRALGCLRLFVGFLFLIATGNHRIWRPQRRFWNRAGIIMD